MMYFIRAAPPTRLSLRWQYLFKLGPTLREVGTILGSAPYLPRCFYVPTIIFSSSHVYSPSPSLFFFCHSKSRHPNLYHYSKSRYSTFPVPTPFPLRSNHRLRQSILFTRSPTTSSPTSTFFSAPQTSVPSSHHKEIFVSLTKSTSETRRHSNCQIKTQDNMPTHHPSSNLLPFPIHLN